MSDKMNSYIDLREVKAEDLKQIDMDMVNGDLRVLFSIEDDTIYIDNIIPRGQAYKRI